MLKSFIANLQAGLKWLVEEMARPMPGIESKASRRHASGPNQKLEPRRRPPPAAPENNHDEDRHHHNQAYDGDAFSTDSSGDGDGGGD